MADIDCETFNGYLLNEPWNIKNKSGTFFKVFTPYWRHCTEIIKGINFKKQAQIVKFSNSKLKNSKKMEILKKGMKSFRLDWEAGSLKVFCLEG